MQKITRDALVNKALALLENGTVDRVLGWKKGELAYDVTPAVFTDGKSIGEGFVWNDFCGANFSKYLIAETKKTGSKVLVFLKPCDTYSFNQLLTEHRFDREKVYAVGIPCEGMADAEKIKNIPSPDILMNSLRSIGYSFKTALADIIDNSINYLLEEGFLPPV